MADPHHMVSFHEEECLLRPASPPAAPVTTSLEALPPAASATVSVDEEFGEFLSAAEGPAVEQAGADCGTGAVVPAAPGPSSGEPSGPPGHSAAASLASVTELLQQLLARSPGPASAVEQQSGQASPQQAPSPASAAAAGCGLLPAELQKLLALELEVVQLQQALQMAQLDVDTQAVAVHSLRQRAQEAEARAAAAEAATYKAQAASAALQGQLAEAQARSMQAGHWRERASALHLESQQLKSHISSACGALKALGIPVHQVFSHSATAQAACISAPCSPTRSPLKRAVASAAAAPALPASPRGAQPASAPPVVPRLRLSSICLQPAHAEQEIGQGEVPQPVDATAAHQQQQEHGHVPRVEAAAVALPPLGGPTEQQALQGMQYSEKEKLSMYCTTTDNECWEEPGGSIPAYHPLPQQQPLQQFQQQPLQQLNLPLQLQPLISQQFHLPLQPQPLTSRRPSTSRGPPSVRGSVSGLMLTARSQARPTPRGGSSALPPRLTYGSDPRFHEVAETFRSEMSGRQEATSRWVRSVFSSQSAVEADPCKVEPLVLGLVELFNLNGVPMPLQRTGPCRFLLGSARAAVRLVNGRLMVRAGAGQQLEMLDWLERQPVRAQSAAVRR